jgi:negative regulator of sigma E activity
MATPKLGLVEFMSHDELKQKLSSWMDDDLVEHSEKDTLYHQCVSDDNTRKTFESYYAIRAVLRNESCAEWKAGFSERVSQALENEPTVFAPRNLKSVKKTLTGWAVAASVAFAVVLGVQMMPLSQSEMSSNQLAGANAASNKQGTMLAEYHVTDDERAQLERINTIFNQFAQQSSAQENGALPYVRVVSGEQVRTYRMSPQQFRQVMMELERRNREAEMKARQELESNQN